MVLRQYRDTCPQYAKYDREKKERMRERKDRWKEEKQASKQKRAKQIQRLLSNKTLYRISIKIFIICIYFVADLLRDHQPGILLFLLRIEANRSFLC